MWRTEVALAVLALGSTAHAANTFELLDWACNADTKLVDVAKETALSDCKMTAGAKKVCDVIDGTPFNCFAPDGYLKDGKGTCQYHGAQLVIKTSTEQTLGWKIEGDVYVVVGRTSTFIGDECRLLKKSGNNDTGVGNFVQRAGKAEIKMVLVADGDGYITFLGGKIFGKAYKKECERTDTADGYIARKKQGCKAFCTTKSAVDEACASDEPQLEDGVWTPLPTTTPTEPTAPVPTFDSVAL